MRFLTRSSSFIIEELVKTNPAIFKDLQYLWDGQRNFYTTKQINLKGEEQVFTVNVNFPHGKPGAFMLKIMRVDRVDLSQVKSFYDKNTGDISERVMSIFDLVFRFMCTGSYVGHQRKFYDMATRQSMCKVSQLSSYFILSAIVHFVLLTFSLQGAICRLCKWFHPICPND